MSGQRKGRRWRWWILGGVGAVAVLLLFAHGIWGIVEQRRLNAALAALAAAGEPTSVDDLKLTADGPPDGENASVDYARAAGRIDPSLPAWRRFVELPDGAFDLPPTDEARAVAAELCRAQAPVLAAVAAGRGKRPGTWHDAFHPEVFLPDDTMGLAATRKVADLLALSATDAAVTGGDGSAAVAQLSDGVALADAAQRRPTLLAHVYATGMAAVAASAVARTMPFVPATPAVRPAMADLLRALLDETDMDAGTQLGWRTEGVTVLRQMRDFAAGHLTGPGVGSVPQGSVVLYVVRPIVTADTAMAVAHVDGLRQAATAVDWPTARRQMPTTVPAALRARPVVHLALAFFVPPANAAVREGYRARANRRLAAVSVAARLFAADHDGRVPTAWADLVPAYLPAVPTDAMDGRPMRLAADPPRAWSVGDDERDDGGVPVDESAPRSKRHGDDVAFLTVQPRPSAATRPSR